MGPTPRRNALMDFTQAASNAVASGISGPVDLIAAGLRAAGVPVPRNALMSSEWMAERGLTRDVPMGAARVLGETAGMVSPAVIAAKAPQVANAFLQAGQNLAAPSVVNRGGAAGQRGIFMGDLSKTWDAQAAARAEAMEKAGADPRAIWAETGTFRGVDGKWRQEISDHNVRPLDRTWGEGADLKAGSPTVTRRQRALAHPALSAAYPDTKGLIVSMRPGESGNASFSSGGVFGDEIALQVSPKYNYKADPSTMLHELQHAIQERQGFARGGAPESMRDEALRMLRRDVASGDIESTERAMSMLPMYQQNAYQRLAGEAEARAVQSRMNLNAQQRRALFPFDSYDVPVNSLIVR